MSDAFRSMGELASSASAGAQPAGWTEKSDSTGSQPLKTGSEKSSGATVRTASEKKDARVGSSSVVREAPRSGGATQDKGREILDEAGPVKMAVRRVYTQKFRGKPVKSRKLLPDMEIGKYGVLAAEVAETLEETFMLRLRSGDSALEHQSEHARGMIMSALWIYLAINGGSIGNADGFGGSAEDSQPLRVADIEVPLRCIVQIFGSKTYAYMRYRATEIRDAVEDLFHTIAQTPDPSPGLLEIYELVRVTAVRRDLASYPQYIAVGSEYAHGTPDHVAAAILRAGAGVLTASGNIREETSKNVRAAQRQ